jgi:hypothetical protein
MTHPSSVRARALPWRRRMAWVLAAVAASAALQGPTAALAASGSVGVMAHVQAWTRVETSGAPAVLSVTSEDVQRGWVQVSEPVVLIVRSNARSGPLLVVFTAGELVQESLLTGFSDPVSLGAGQGTIQLPQQRPSDPVRYQVNVRLQLAAGVQPGEYAFPVRFGWANGETVSSAAR